MKKQVSAVVAASMLLGGLPAFATVQPNVKEVEKPVVQLSTSPKPSPIVPDNQGKPVWPTTQKNVLTQYGFDSSGSYRPYATLSAMAGDDVKAVFGGVVESISGDCLTIRSNGISLTYSNVTSSLVNANVVNGGDVIGKANGDIQLSALKNKIPFDPVASFWPDMSCFTAQEAAIAKKKAALKSEEEQKKANVCSANCPTSMEPIFQNAARQYGVDANLLKAVASVESGFNPASTSPAGAMGVMQLMPGTAVSQGVSAPYDVAQNIYGGARHIKELLLGFNGNVAYTLAGYNAGADAVRKYNGVPPYTETRNYVAEVLRQYSLLKGERHEKSI